MVHLSSDSQLETILKEVFFTVTALNLLGTFKGIMSEYSKASLF